MENFSENPTESKRKRGRPRAFTAEFEQELERFELVPRTDTGRSNLDKKYFHHAFRVLADAPNPERFRYLVPDEDKVKEGRAKFPRKTILAELGHLDEADMLECAEIICREKWPTKEAVRRIRAWRLGKPILPKASQRELSNLVFALLREYCNTHEDVDIQLIFDACQSAAEASQDFADD